MTKNEKRLARKKRRASINTTRELILMIRAMPKESANDICSAMSWRTSWSSVFNYCYPLNKTLLRGIRDLIRKAHKGIDIKL